MSFHKGVIYGAYHQGNHLGDVYHSEQGLVFRITNPFGLEQLMKDPMGDLVSLEGDGRSHLMGSRHFGDCVKDAVIIQAMLPE